MLLSLTAYLIASWVVSFLLTVFLVSQSEPLDPANCWHVYVQEKVYLLCLIWPAWPRVTGLYERSETVLG